MKQSCFSFLPAAMFSLLLPCLLAGQTPCGAAYTRIIADGDALFEKGLYKEAFEKYRAARGCSEAEHQVLDKKTEAVFRAVNGEREKADKSAALARQLQRKAETALKQAQEAKAKAEAAEAKATAVLNKIYFYEDRFGLAYENGQYGFIDKNLKTKIGFRYVEAMPFDYTGFAWVKRMEIVDNETYEAKPFEFLIDTLGNEFPLVYDDAGIKETTTALDLRTGEIDTLPHDIFRHTQLKILLLRGNRLKRLPPEIGNLKNLIFLGLSENKLKQLPPELGHLENLKMLQVFGNELVRLPPELGKLKNLTFLDLSYNHIDQLPTELGNLKNLKTLSLYQNPIDKAERNRISRLLPNCKIYF